VSDAFTVWPRATLTRRHAVGDAREPPASRITGSVEASAVTASVGGLGRDHERAVLGLWHCALSITATDRLVRYGCCPRLNTPSSERTSGEGQWCGGCKGSDTFLGKVPDEPFYALPGPVLTAARLQGDLLGGNRPEEVHMESDVPASGIRECVGLNPATPQFTTGGPLTEP
jgi:hypothetical protein